jgi:hypothetical protein
MGASWGRRTGISSWAIELTVWPWEAALGAQEIRDVPLLTVLVRVRQIARSHLMERRKVAALRLRAETEGWLAELLM